MNWNKYKKNIIYKNKWVYNWFSNMIPCDIVVDGKKYGSTENYYQAMKTTNVTDHDYIAKLDPHTSKHKVRELENKTEAEWDAIKIDVMRTALIEKFNQPEWKEKLLATNHDKIIEWNNWNDKFWGVSVKDGVGENHLGLLLMEIRTNFKYKCIFKRKKSN